MKTRMMMAAMLSAAVLGTVATTAAATDAPEGYVTFFADKAVIGQGLVTEPVLVPYYDGDNGIDIVTDEEAISTTKRLIREEGILCGISSGTNVAAALRLAKQLGPGKTVVTVLPDTGERYFSTELF